MRREDGMVMGRARSVQEKPALRRFTKREIDRRITALGSEIARAFEDRDGERIEYLGEELFPRPMDTRTLIRIMSRHLVFN